MRDLLIADRGICDDSIDCGCNASVVEPALSIERRDARPEP
jgi:hypothetical protein